MQFDSFADFIAMGGYGFYVWLAFGTCFIIMLAILIESKISHKRILSGVSEQLAREARIRKAKQGAKS